MRPGMLSGTSRVLRWNMHLILWRQHFITVEMVIFVSGINTDYSCVRFLETYECERYIRYNRDLLFEDASQEIRRRIEEL